MFSSEENQRLEHVDVRHDFRKQRLKPSFTMKHIFYLLQFLTMSICIRTWFEFSLRSKTNIIKISLRVYASVLLVASAPVGKGELNKTSDCYFYLYGLNQQ